MNLNIKKSKTIHFSLFVFILFLQIIVFGFWFSDIKKQNSIYKSAENLAKPNLAITLSNQAIGSYFLANNSFNEYLNSRSQKDYLEYHNSLLKMASDLEQLSLLVNKNNLFSEIIESKKGTQEEVIKLKQELDFIIHNNFNSAPKLNEFKFKVKSYDYETALSSITYDSTKTIHYAKKKGLLGRIGNAIKGKPDIEKQEIQSVIKMVFNQQEKSGSFEDQLKNIFNVTENYYKGEISNLRKVYLTIKVKDKDLLIINKSILAKSQEILLLYSSSAQEANKIEHLNIIKNYDSSLKGKKMLMLMLLLSISIITILLLLYTIYSYRLEKKLLKAKNETEINLDKKNQLIGMISHEIRAPLDIISNSSNKIKSLNTNLELNTIIDSLNFTANSLQITSSQILDFFKNENNTLLLYNKKINLKNEIRAILESLKSLAELKKIEIIYNIRPELNEKVWADNVKIHQLFYNLIGNAIKFTDGGTITVETSLTTRDNQHRFDVKITDTGSGIPPEEIDKIFDKFYQSKSHKEQISFGAGLGLALCKNIIELFDGTISVVSEINKGTEISFFLMLDKLSPEQETYKTKIINQFKNNPKEILIIDDDPIILLVIEKLVTKINFKATTFQKVDSAKLYLETNVVDMIITDLQIFEYSGIDFIKDIKKIKNSNVNTPIIAVTGDSYANKANLSKFHIDDVLIKPINKEELFSKIYKLLNK